MVTGKSRIAALAALTLAGGLAAPVSAAPPPDLADMIGGRAASGEPLLKARGYQFVRETRVGSTAYAYWSKGESCVEIGAADGRYATIERVDDCGAADSGADARGGATVVRFDPGASGATLTGVVEGGERHSYALDLEAGRRFNADLSSTRAYMNVIGPKGETLFNGSIEGAHYNGGAPASGSYRIEVYLMRDEARRGTLAPFSLIVSTR
ncbi:hypothetical protein [Caulobacter mirabilis]|uniref:Uncharacterized protein n=1 Tax=Caulobacter mirabilis TaxID=69666 RepID=A0A2D2AYN3_9CAUL|nr:hypothetical protein [Caulobacter mirabilis]ATQ43037.1 hypothetical protein CSW64_11760 [Caulobacter mirabilis]